MSLPLRERGLKQKQPQEKGSKQGVAPLAGAWIETFNRSYSCVLRAVAPLAGAWIETLKRAKGVNIRKLSLPLRERGLKHKIFKEIEKYLSSLPLRERGLKHSGGDDYSPLLGRSPCGSVD